MKVKKKFFALGLSSVFLLSSAVPAWADSAPAKAAAGESQTAPKGDEKAAAAAKISKDEAIRLAKEKAEVPADYEVRGISYSTDYMVKAGGVWNINFEKTVKERNVYANFHVAISGEDGRLLSFNRYENDPDKKPSYPPAVDYPKAKEIGLSLLHKMNPDLAATVAYNDMFEKNFRTPLQGEVRYLIRFDRTVNGIRFPQQFVHFEIDGEGKVVGYQFAWSDTVTFDSPPPAVKKEESLDTYKGKAKPTLRYLILNRPGQKPEIALTYTLNPYPLDAKTGEMISSGPYFGSEFPAGAKTITEKPLAAMPSPVKSLDKDQAAAKARAALDIPENAVLEDASYNEYGDMKPTMGQGSAEWNLNFRVGEDKDRVSYRVNVNAKTGEIRYYYPEFFATAPAPDANAQKLTAEQLEQKAADFIKKVLPHYTHQLVINTESLKNMGKYGYPNGNAAHVEIRRVVNGIPTEYESASLGIDMYTGKILNFWNNITGLKYPATLPETIGEQKAKEVLMAQYDLELQYFQEMPVQVYMGKEKPSSENDKPARLVYMPVRAYMEENIYLDAVTGTWKNRETGETVQPGKTIVTDIENHWAKKELQLMVDYKGLSVTDGKVNPEQAITRGEMVKMLIIALNGGYYYPYYGGDRAASYKDVAVGSTYFSYVESAVDLGILDRSSENFNPDGVISREELAQLLVKALGYNKLAQREGLFSLTVKDADKVKLKGHVAIVVSLGIMKGSDGYFDPDGQVTRAMAAKSFYQFLQARPQLHDGPMR